MNRYAARFTMMVLVAALSWLTGCASSQFEKGLKNYQPDDPVAAVRELRPLAEQGHADAQFKLGSLYYQGWGVPQDHREAVKWLRKAADQGYVLAQTTLGTIYTEGTRGLIVKDYPQALMWYVFATAKGDMEAMQLRELLAKRMTPSQIAEAQKLVREYKPENVYTQLFEETKKLAEQNNADAQFRAGVMYYTGQGAPRDYGQALSWFKKAARQGHPLAQYNTGYMYEKGEGTAQDYVEAARFYRSAAERGNLLAQFMLGSMFEKGHGVAQDEVQALMWYSLAAVQGESSAKAARERVTIWMTPAQIAEAQRLAREFKRVEK